MAHLARVYMCHAPDDTAWCREFVEALRWSGADVHPGAAQRGRAGEGDEEIERALRTRPVVVLVLTPAAVHSPPVQHTVELALQLRRDDPERLLLPVVAAQCSIPPAWRTGELVSGLNESGLTPFEAASRTASVLEAIAIRTRRAPAVRIGGDTAEGARESAHVLRSQGRLEEALVAYDRALALDPLSSLAWYGKGNLLLDLERHEEAIAAYDHALTSDPMLALAWYGKAVTFEALGLAYDALDACDHALGINARLTPAWAGKGDILSRLERYEEAVACYDRALALAPEDARTWRHKGDALRELGRQRDGARVPSHRVTHGSPTGGSTFHQLKLYEEALAAYDRALALAPRYLKAWTSKIHLLDDLGRAKEAAEGRRLREQAIHGS